MNIPNIAKLTLKLFGNVARTEHLLIQERRVKKKSRLTKRTKFDIVRDTGVIVMGMKSSRAKRYTIDVPFKAKIKPGSILLMGTNTQLNELERYAR